jgi:hypothetical protein
VNQKVCFDIKRSNSKRMQSNHDCDQKTFRKHYSLEKSEINRLEYISGKLIWVFENQVKQLDNKSPSESTIWSKTLNGRSSLKKMGKLSVKCQNQISMIRIWTFYQNHIVMLLFKIKKK